LYDDITLLCRDCGASFTFTAGEQKFFERKGFESAPSRCPDCRTASGGGYSSGVAHQTAAKPEQLFAATCAQCGQATQASARLVLGDGPIYCPICILLQPDIAAVRLMDGWQETW